MATRTTYLNLIKPDYSDAADIADINANMDTLDDKIKGIDSAAIDDTLVPSSDRGTIRNQLSQLANRIKAATGAGDWKDDPSTTLASLATLVSNLASGSDVTWNGKKFTNKKLGVSGLIDQNGYIAFGPNFGGLIIQWIYGAIPVDYYYTDFVLPVTLKSRPFVVIPADVIVASVTRGDSGNLIYSYEGSTPASVRIITDNSLISIINAIIVGF